MWWDVVHPRHSRGRAPLTEVLPPFVSLCVVLLGPLPWPACVCRRFASARGPRCGRSGGGAPGGCGGGAAYGAMAFLGDERPRVTQVLVLGSICQGCHCGACF